MASLSPDASISSTSLFDVPVQTSLEQSIPLHQVTFCVVDLETTGGSPVDSRITEVGAVTYRGGERLAEFQSLVNPGVSIPAFISHLTGISDHLVANEPPIEGVLPAFLEFAKGTVFVAHNAGFDFRFLNANLVRLDYDPIPGPPVCTAKLARRVVWPEVRNVKLRTLAEYFRTRVQPNHRALADAHACAEVLHGLLDLGGRLGILTLGDLREASRAQGRPHYAKIRLADHLPHAPGVYIFRGRDDQVLYVGKSNDLRGRVKSYFYGDTRKKIEDLLAEVVRVEGVRTRGGELDALVLEARLIARHEPKYNRQGKSFRRYAYLRLDTREAYPRLKTVRRITVDGGQYLGPFSSAGRAASAKEALEEVFAVRRCTKTMGIKTRFAACALADIGRCVAPCVGGAGPERYGELVGELVSSLTAPGELLAALEHRMCQLAEQERYEEAGLVRDRLRSLADALRRRRMDTWLIGAGELELTGPGGRVLRFNGGSLDCEQDPDPAPAALTLPCPRERADELAAIRSWLTTNSVGIRVERCDRPLFEPVNGGKQIATVLDLARAAQLPQASRDPIPAIRRGA
ncbi:MAG: polymerase subunit epsilon [Actinomycetota bacterium]|nr:polymerase subunit epsilon [Actinomycetota bacterium]